MKLVGSGAFFLVLMFSHAVAASPLSPYADRNNEVSSLKQHAADSSTDKKKRVTEEEVKAYLIEKLGQKLDPASIMEYLVDMIQKKGGSDRDRDAQCIPNDEGTNILRKSSLTYILDTLHPINGRQRHHGIVMALDKGEHLYVQDSDNDHINAYIEMINDLRHNRDNIRDDGNIWVNYSPCRLCTAALLDYFKEGERPTIHIARIHTNSTVLSDAIEAVQCMARLEHEGFSITPWNFESYINDLEGLNADSSCTDEIQTYLSDSTFNREYMQLGTDLTFIHELSSSEHAHSWCS